MRNTIFIKMITKTLRFLMPLFVVSALLSSLHAVDIRLSGEPVLLSGDENDVSAYRFPTSTVFKGEPVDLLLEVVGQNSGRDNTIGRYVSWSVASNTISLWPTPATCEYLVSSENSWLDLKVTVVKKDTFQPVVVDQLVMTGYDIDTWVAGGIYKYVVARDYIMAETAHAVVLDTDSKLSLASVNQIGSGGIQYTEQLNPYGNDCADSTIDPKCNGSLVYQDTASFSFRAYTKTGQTYSRLIGITFSAEVLDNYGVQKDFGDAPESYGDASHDVSHTIYLGGGLFPDSEAASNFSIYADGDDQKALNRYDDDDGVLLYGNDLQSQELLRGQVHELSIRTKGEGYLFAWADWNRDGIFDEEEKIIDAISPQSSESNVSITVPMDAVAGRTYLRFRYSDQNVLLADGEGGQGEVEDYSVTVSSSCLAPIVRSKVGKNQIVWKDVDNNATYTLYRSLDENASFEKVYEGGQTLYLDRDISPDRLYYYKIEKADNDATCSSKTVAVYAPKKRMRMAVVPSLEHLEYTKVPDALHKNNLLMGETYSRTDDSVRKNHIISHSPAANSFLKKDYGIDLVLSDNEQRSYLNNHKPVIASIPIETLTYNSSNNRYTYFYRIHAEDQDGDALSFKLLESLEDMHLSNIRKVGTVWYADLKWTPDTSIKGFQTISLEVKDSKGAKTVQTWNIFVDYPTMDDTQNTPPTIHSTPIQTIKEDEQYTYELNATDADGDKVSYKILKGISGMSFTGNRLTWKAKVGVNSVYQVEIGVTDCKGAITKQAWEITVTDPNQTPKITSTPPTAARVGEYYNYYVKGNDPDGVSLKYTLLKKPSGMYVSSTRVYWRPTAAQIGTHYVTVRVEDYEGAYVDQNWTINVTGNQPPRITSTPPTTARVGETYNYYVKGNDPDGVSLKYTLLKKPSGMYVSSTRVYWRPTAAQIGTHYVTVRVEDYEGAYVDQNWTINVTGNQPPVVKSNPPTSARVGKSYQYTPSVVDSDGYIVKREFIKAPSGMRYSYGRVSWTPTKEQIGVHQVSFRVTDNEGDYVDQNWVINVTGNQPPVIKSNPPVTARVTKSYQYTPSMVDSDGYIAKRELIKAPSGMNYSYSSVRWTPTKEQIGVHQVSFRITDNEGAYVDQNWTINVTGNQPPVIKSNPPVTARVAKGYQYTPSMVDSDGYIAKRELIKAPSGMNYSYSRVNWTPTKEQIGVHQVSFRVTDNEGAYVDQNWTINVTGNQPPLVTSDPSTLAQVGIRYTYTSSVTDPDGYIAKREFIKAPSGMYWSGSRIYWTPTVDQNATGHTVVARYTDNEGAYVDQNWTINVGGIAANKTPRITSSPILSVEEGKTYLYDAEAVDADGDTLSYALKLAPEDMIINEATGLIEWVVPAGLAGYVDVNLSVNDIYGASIDQTFRIAIHKESIPNRQPIITSAPVVVSQKGLLYVYEVHASDADGDLLNYQLNNAPQGMEINATSGRIEWIPSSDSNGYEDIILSVHDASGSYIQQSYRLAIHDYVVPNREPLITSIPSVVSYVDTPYRYPIQASDADGDSLNYILDNGPAGMELNASSAEITWTPLLDDVGHTEVSFSVYDTKGAITRQSYRLGVLAEESPNREPRITSIPIVESYPGVPYSYQVIANDADDDNLTYSLEHAPADMSIDEATGLIEWVPSENDTPFVDVNLSVSDIQGAKTNQFYRLVVHDEQAPNREPLIISAPIVVSYVDTAYLYQVIASDADDDNLTFALLEAPQDMQIDSHTGLIQWIPTQSGYVNVTLSVSDIYGASVEQSYRLAIHDDSAPNREPLITSTPVSIAQIETQYHYQVIAVDADDDNLSYMLTNAPLGMQINAISGLITWMPQTQGYADVSLQVSDPYGGTVGQSYRIAIHNEAVPNRAPVISSSPVSLGKVEVPYNYQIVATDADGDALQYTLLEAPEGMDVNATGMITWLPTINDFGLKKVSLEVSDTKGAKVAQSYLITVSPRDNLAPSLHSTPVNRVIAGQTYLYDINATDPDGDALTYVLLEGPLGMTLDQNSSTIRWVPTSQQYGISNVKLKISDPLGASLNQEWAIFVDVDDNTAPTINSTPVTQAYTANSYRYQVLASDANGDALSYSLTAKPSGMLIDPDSGLISWTADLTQVGVHSVTVRVRDIKGAFSEQSYTVLVEEAPAGVSIELTLSDTIINEGESVNAYVKALAPDEEKRVYFYVNNEEVRLDENGHAVILGKVSGVYEVLAVVVTANDSAYQTKYFTVRDPEDSSAPEVSISSPSENETVTFISDVIGNVHDENLATYELSVAPLGSDTFTLLTQGTQTVTEGILGTLDATVLSNGIYLLKLVATDVNGRKSSATQTIIIDGKAKIGNFSFTVTDFDIKVGGLPVQVNRTYSTLQRTQELDFGYAWSIDYQNVKLQENTHPGRDWKATADLFVGYCFKFDKQHIVNIALPDGTTETFEFKFERECGHYSIGSYYDAPKLYALNGSEARLEVVDASDTIYMNSQGEIIDSMTLKPYNPSIYRLSLSNGMVYEVSELEGIKEVKDIRGDTITYNSEGILSSRGESLTFERDTKGRITKITDLAGKSVSYFYNDNDDLDYVIDQMGYTTEYTYQEGHLLEEWFDPSGRRITQNIYDESGRLIETIDPDGNVVEFTHDIDGKEEIITDKLGRINLYVYDESGNVLSHTNPLGESITRTYDLNGNELTVTDPLGNTITNTYDANDNLLTTTDASGNTETTTYKSHGAPLSISDKNGNTMDIVYNDYNEPRSFTTASGAVNTMFYDQFGNKIESINEYDQKTTYVYDEWTVPYLGALSSKGNLLKETRPDGTVIEHTYDASSNLLSTTKTLTDGTSTTLSNTYDEFNRMVSSTDELGQITTYAYDARGNKISTTDPQARVTSYRYNNRNKLVQTTYPDGTTESKSYDVMDNLLSETNQEGETTTYEYDDADRLIKTTYADGSFTSSTYDEAGRTTSSIDENGNVTSYEYDAVGNRIKIIDALNNTTAFTYDAAGNMLSMTDALNQMTSYEYNSLNQRVRTIYPDGTSIEETKNISGLPIAKTDEAGYTTGYGYDTTRTIPLLNKVTLANNAITSYGYDSEGKKTTQIDALGRTTAWSYKATGELESETLPLGQSKTFTYDTYGKQTQINDYANKAIKFIYDSNDRLARTEYADGSTVTYAYTPSGRVKTLTDSQGSITNTYDVRGRLKSQTNPSGETITYSYDSVGNIIQVETPTQTISKTYDAVNRLESVTDDKGTTTYTYDAIGRQTQITYPNGATTHYAYNSRNWVTNIEHKNSSSTVLQSFTYTLDAVGNRTRIVENTGRTTTYEYNSVHQLTKETITNDPNDLNTVTVYSYDLVGNLVTKTVDQVTIDYTYNENDQLTQQGSTTFTYDANGNLIAKDDTTYSYDDRNRLIEVVSPTDTITYSYDANDNRVAKVVNGGITTYLIDANMPYAQVITESKEDGTTIEYTYGNDLISNDTSYFLTDALGSTRGLINQTEQLTDTYSYSPYGELNNHTGSSENNLLYTGEQFDSETSNYYLRARYYSPQQQRFTSIDPFKGRMFEPITLNDYIYAGNNPVIHVDPSGEFFVGFVSMSSSIISTTISAYPRVAVTVEQGAIASMYARALVLGMHMRNEALDDIMLGIKKTGVSQQTMQDAYDKYYYATKYMSMVTGTARDVFLYTGWMRATTGFAQGLTRMPLAQYSSVPVAYLAKTDGLNRMVITKLDKIVQDPIKFETSLEIIKDMSSLIRRILDGGAP